jgi:hypothetical protein
MQHVYIITGMVYLKKTPHTHTTITDSSNVITGFITQHITHLRNSYQPEYHMSFHGVQKRLMKIIPDNIYHLYVK